MKPMTRILCICGMFLSMMMAMNASADTMSLTMDTPNTALGAAATGPYAQLDINLLDSTHATFDLSALPNSSYIFMIGDGGSIGLNVNASSFFYGGVTSTTSAPGHTAPSYSTDNGANLDGWGSFNFVLDNIDGFTNAVTDLQFELTNTSGTWSSATDVLTANSKDNLAATHIFVVNLDGTNTGKTGFATSGGDGGGGGGGGTPVPEPGTVILLGSGLVGLALFGRKRFAR